MKNNRLKQRIYARASHFSLHFCAAIAPIRPLKLPDATFWRWHKHAMMKLSFPKFKLVCVLYKGVIVRTILLLNAPFKYWPSWGRRVAGGSKPPTSRPCYLCFLPFALFWFWNILAPRSLSTVTFRSFLPPPPALCTIPIRIQPGLMYSLERLRFTFTPNGRLEFVPRDQVCPLFSVYSLLLLHKNK